MLKNCENKKLENMLTTIYNVFHKFRRTYIIKKGFFNNSLLTYKSKSNAIGVSFYSKIEI